MPILAIVSVNKLILHEHHDDQRTPPIVESLRNSGVLRNPPIITPLHDRTGRYMVLDGANRTTAFQKMETPHIVAQIVERDDPGLKLKPWNHVVWGESPRRLYNRVKAIEGVELQSTTKDQAMGDVEARQALVAILVANQNDDVYIARSNAVELAKKVVCLNELVDCYQAYAQSDRTKSTQVEPLKELYPDLTGLVIMPRFHVEEIIYLAGEGHLMPPGITRFTIAPRVLHINYPLDRLISEVSLSKKNDQLEDWIQGRLARKKVRYYAEPTFIFDE